MATILLSAAGAALGAGFGGSVLGLSGAVIGRAVGATLGRAIDQKLIGSGSRAVETGRVDRLRIAGASEGAPVGLVWGRMRVAGQVIWASRFREQVRRAGGGKGTPQPKTRTYSYSVSLAVALCEGVIGNVGRVWADGNEIAPGDLNLRVYRGTEDQAPDPKIEAVEGSGKAPAYRGIAYVVIEDLSLERFGNRVPQLSFEVFRPAQASLAGAVPDLSRGVRGVALIPGTGEYALATSPVHYRAGVGRNVSANVNGPSRRPDLTASLDALEAELPECGSVSVVVSWFGDDLRCGDCTIRPKVESRARDGEGMPWRSGGITRAAAEEVALREGKPVYGGTPADRAVIQAIQALKARGKHVTYYPFILMDQVEGNGQPDPWSDTGEQPSLPWRGRITTSVAPGLPGSPDRSPAAEDEVQAFFGSAAAADFSRDGTTIGYAGPDEWGYRRFILHQAHLCAAAGGADAFSIGSEMRGLTRIRGQGDSFPAVAALRQLAEDVRGILGPGVKIGYAADWSEYAGFEDGDGDRYFHLDPLWADTNIDFVGVDNYLPLSDWRDGFDHADAAAGSIYDLDYLKANVAGGEGYDWYYASQEHRAAQIRTPITDGAYGEPWVWRVKDIRSWWSYPHHERIGGVRQEVSTAWVPRSKPIWFTEYGCPAIDKGTNEPNKFVDPKSSESSLPRFSSGRRDDLIQMQYLRAMQDYWSDEANNPVSDIYGGSMVDMDRAHVWAWDSRPFPQFPGNATLWSDGDNYRRGHWLSGRATAQPLASVVAEICERSGLQAIDVSQLHGLVRGYQVAEVASARAALQPLMLTYGFEAVERDGVIRFQLRDGRVALELERGALALAGDLTGLETTRGAEAEIAGRVRLSYVEAEGDYEARAVEAILPDEAASGVAQSEAPLALVRAEARGTVERWLAEARVARDQSRFALPPSLGWIGAGDVVRFGEDRYRIDRLERAEALTAEAVRIEPGIYMPSDETEERTVVRGTAGPVPLEAIFLDLPLLTGSEVAHAPYLAATASPWPGGADVYTSDQDAGYARDLICDEPAVVGVTETPLPRAGAALWDRGAALRVKVSGGTLSSVPPEQLLNGANLMAIGDGGPDGWEIFQFAEASLVGPDTYELALRLRGQAGTEADMPETWPAGSTVVLLDGAPRQISLGLDQRDLARHFRIGPSDRPLEDPSYLHLVQAFRGNGLRPYAPAHLRQRQLANGDVAVEWVRRTRIGGDSWSGVDVPLGETSERYIVRVSALGVLLREEAVMEPRWIYQAAAQAADGATAPFTVEVAQISDVYGPGPFTRSEIDG